LAIQEKISTLPSFHDICENSGVEVDFGPSASLYHNLCASPTNLYSTILTPFDEEGVFGLEVILDQDGLVLLVGDRVDLLLLGITQLRLRLPRFLCVHGYFVYLKQVINLNNAANEKPNEMSW
jgi:hypothetical protein